MGSNGASNWSLACFQDYGKTGSVAIIQCKDGDISVRQIAKGDNSGADNAKRPIYLSCDENGKAVMMDAVDKTISLSETVPEDAFGIYYYPDTQQEVMWCTIDGDKESGSDPVNCPQGGAAVMAMSGHGEQTTLHKVIGLGPGHHVVTTINHSDFPKKAFISSLLDGSLAVIANDPQSSDYLSIIENISLCQSDKEKDGRDGIPNNAFPHGMAFSALTGKIYCLNNGYGNINVVDPLTHKIETLIEMKVSSNLLLSPCGQFLIGKGADRKGNPDHVMGRLCVVDVVKQNMATVIDLQDIYPSCYRFSPKGDKLYVTTAATGKGTQKDNLIYDTLYVYDTTNLPQLRLQKEIKVGQADCGRRSICFLKEGDQTPYVFVSNPSDGSVTILDADDNIVDTVTIGEPGASETAFSYWDGRFYGA